MAFEKIVENLFGELKRGTLVFVVLLNTKEPTYGYALIQKLQDQGIDIDRNTLYPLARRLEKQDLLVSDWDTSETRPRKYYKISEMGTAVLEKLTEEWHRTHAIIETMLQDKEA